MAKKYILMLLNLTPERFVGSQSKYAAMGLLYSVHVHTQVAILGCIPWSVCVAYRSSCGDRAVHRRHPVGCNWPQGGVLAQQVSLHDRTNCLQLRTIFGVTSVLVAPVLMHWPVLGVLRSRGGMIAVQVALGLHYLHRHNIIHFDVKSLVGHHFFYQMQFDTFTLHSMTR